MLVRAKRAGWDQRDGELTEHDELDVPAWIDDGMSETVEGELRIDEFPADEMYRQRTVHTVDGQIVDPETIEPIKS